MNSPWARALRTVTAVIALGAPATSHITRALGQGDGAAISLAIAQAIATGTLITLALPTRRWLGPTVTITLLVALAAGARHSPETALLAMTGTAHTLLYAALLLLFATSLAPPRTALVTRIAARLNPTFHPGMVPYTRKVTLAWALLFAAELLASALLLAAHSPLWPGFVSYAHIAPIILAALAEALIRRWRWRHEHPTSLIETIRGTRRLMRRP